jgi:hypothetical protein
MLKSVFGSTNVRNVHVDEDTSEWYMLYSRLKRPDIIVQDAGGNGRTWIIDVKTACADARTHVSNDHTDRRALGALTELERSIHDEYTDGGRDPTAIAAGCTLICVAVGRHGGLGSGTLNLINMCARRRGNRVGADEAALASGAATFTGVWRHRLSVLVAAATARQTRLLSCPSEWARRLCDDRRERARRQRERHRDAQRRGPGGGHPPGGGDDRDGDDDDDPPPDSRGGGRPPGGGTFDDLSDIDGDDTGPDVGLDDRDLDEDLSDADGAAGASEDEAGADLDDMDEDEAGLGAVGDPPAPRIQFHGTCLVCAQPGEAYSECGACDGFAGGAPIEPADVSNDPLAGAGDVPEEEESDGSPRRSDAGDDGDVGECMSCPARGRPYTMCLSCGSAICAPGIEYFFGEWLTIEEIARRRAAEDEEEWSRHAAESTGALATVDDEEIVLINEEALQRQSAGALTPPPMATPGLPATEVLPRGRKRSRAERAPDDDRSRSRGWAATEGGDGEGEEEDEHAALE